MGLFKSLINIADHVVTLPLDVVRDVVDPHFDGHHTAKRVHKLVDEIDGSAEARRRRHR